MCQGDSCVDNGERQMGQRHLNDAKKQGYVQQKLVTRS